MKVSILKSIGAKKTTLLLVPSIEYNRVITSLAKEIASKNVCYVTLNKTFTAIQELFKKNKIPSKSFVFIDAITKAIQNVDDQTKSCYYVSSPGALTELSLVITKFIKHNFDYLIFDSITNLSTYNDQKVVEKFLISLINKVKTSNTKSIFLALNVEEQKSLIDKASTFVDNVIDLGKVS